MIAIILYTCFVAFVILVNSQYKRNKSHINDLKQDDNTKVSDSNFDLLEIELDTLHAMDKSIDKLLNNCDSEKERIQLLNKKATTINKIKRLEKELEKLL